MSQPAVAQTPEAKELSLVGKVELRIALTDSEKKLEAMLNTYLAPLLLKLASDYMSVRNKPVISSIKLPIATLLKQYKDCHNSIVRHFDLLYIQQGIDRLPVKERLDLLPTLVHGLADNYLESKAHTASLFNVLLRLLHHLVLPQRGTSEDLALRVRLGLAEKPRDAEFIATWLGKLTLYNNPTANAKSSPGLSPEDCEFLQVYGKNETWTSDSPNGLNLTETKIVSTKFLSSGAFVERERFIPALFASADSNSRLSTVGDDILKRATPVVSLEDPDLLQQLYDVLIGTRGPMGSLPARKSLQTKILALFCRSKEATTFTSQILQIVREALEPRSQDNATGTSAPKQGLDVSKLKAQIFAFTNWVARVGSEESLKALAPTLVAELRDYIESQGWHRINEESSNVTAAELGSRSFCYESIGLLAKACPGKILVEPNLDLLRWLFVSLACDSTGSDISISIEQALGSVLSAFVLNTDADVEAALTDLLLHNMTLKLGEVAASGIRVIRSTRYVAVRFANRCLPFHNVKARWIDVLALTNGPSERNEVIEEGRRGLDPFWYRNLNPLDDLPAIKRKSPDIPRYQMPEFHALVGLFFMDEKKGALGVHRRLSFGYNPAISFCRGILLHHALASNDRAPVVDVDWKKNIDAVIMNDEIGRKEIMNYLAVRYGTSGAAQTTLLQYIGAIFDGLVDESFKESDVAGNCLLELCSLGPAAVLDKVAPQAPQLRGAIFSNRHASRSIASHVFGILASRERAMTPDIDNMLKIFFTNIEKWHEAIGSQAYEVHGSILATAYWLSRKLFIQNECGLRGSEAVAFIRLIFDILDKSRDKELLSAATLAIDQLSLFGSLSPDAIPSPYSAEALVDKMKLRSEAGDEESILALGHFAMQCAEEEDQKCTLIQIVDTLYSLHEKRHPELQFAVGAALSCAAAGWESKSLIGLQDVAVGSTPRDAARSSILGSILEKVLGDCKTTKPALRQGAVIWLLCMVQYCGHMVEVQTRLRSCQAAFKGFLSDRESLNQETASRGLTLVYERGDRGLKDDLIRDLVGSFTGTNTSLAGNVSNETQLFEPGALPTGDGSVTTYKDIMSLAAEVGDSSLVYRFMSLASNNAIWSSRAAFGRFGLSNILSDSSVDGYLAENPKLYPALYRYRFDPNTNVRNAMNDIWSALVKDPQSIIDKHFDSIMEDLLKNILGKEWRVRQASCAAIADLVQGRAFEKYETYLSRIWTLTFKVCDDIKVSVRKAAMALARVLTADLTRSLEAGQSSRNNVDIMLKEVLPFLLSPSGLESSAQEVQAFALKTLLQIIKSSKAQILRPFVPDLVGRLLALLSSLEPQEINYLHLNADKYGMTGQQIDDIRLGSVKASPMMEAIERCLDMLDEEAMKQLQPSLENALKTTIGLPSRVGVSRVLVSLSTRHNFWFRPYADIFLKLLRRQVLDRNDTISTSFAAASGYVARMASNEALLSLFEYSKKLYFDSGEDEKHRIISAELVSATAKHATDRFNSLASDILPFVFIAKHDSNDRTKDLFNNTWNENVGGARAVLLYLNEIISAASPHLDSPRWSIKHTAAFAIADVVKSAGAEIKTSDAEIIWPALEKAVSGKTWDGKETVLEAFVNFAKHSTLWKSNQNIADQMQSIMLRESKRNNTQYRQHALAHLGDFVEACNNVDWYDRVYPVMEPLIQGLLDDDHDMDVDSKTGGPSSKITSEQTLANAIKTLLRSIDPTFRDHPRLILSLRQTLVLVERTMSRKDRVVMNAVMDGENTLFGKVAKVEHSEDLDATLAEYVATIFSDENGTEPSRTKAAEVAVCLAGSVGRGGLLVERLEHHLTFALSQERSPLIRQVLQSAQKAIRGGS